MACLCKVDTLTQVSVLDPYTLQRALQSQIEGSEEEIQMRKNTHIEQINYFNSITNRNVRFPNKQPIQGTALTFLAKTQVTVSAEYCGLDSEILYT